MICPYFNGIIFFYLGDAAAVVIHWDWSLCPAHPSSSCVWEWGPRKSLPIVAVFLTKHDTPWEFWGPDGSCFFRQSHLLAPASGSVWRMVSDVIATTSWNLLFKTRRCVTCSWYLAITTQCRGSRAVAGAKCAKCATGYTERNLSIRRYHGWLIRLTQ